MPDLSLAPAWTALFLGLFAFFAGIGELRKPGHWHTLIQEIVASPALQLATGLLELFLGAVIYIANPWASPDWLSSVLSVVGGLMCIEALMVIAFSDVYMAFWVRRFGPLSKLWSWASVVIGLALIAVAMLHF
ncbi:MAG: hypothetical protein CMH85_09155 [Novosphingobium sp.]|jgi:uncharacterized protein YjeT (DUF2065 family)|uniref:Uncharacterized protein n=1 Tax=Novosphingobium indicum TaxID=462949 RepID=A0ABQ2JUR0_9SPHN|nr:hypothetical protein [Novosphingobium indicum]MAC58430.1 hypothetical protein [Novosphingobium sp.]GGN57854.1 hypothetical protein GCM10011349_36820 [Novosphingobium indicum]